MSILKLLYISKFILLIVLTQMKAQSQPHFYFRSVGMHIGSISNLDTDNEGNFLLTTSLDNTAKLWDAKSGELLKTFVTGEAYRHYVPGSISPDGQIIAFGSQRLHVFDNKTGKHFHRSLIFPEPITAIRFSKDGSFLAMSIKNFGIQILETRSWSVISKLDFDNPNLTQMAFDRAGWLAVATNERLYFFDNQFNLNKSVWFSGYRYPHSLAFSPDGSVIAIGYFLPFLPEVFDAGTLEFLYSPQLPEPASIEGPFWNVAFSADSRYLYASGRAGLVDHTGQLNLEAFRNQTLIGRWSRKGRGDFSAFPAELMSANAMLVLPGGEIVISGNHTELMKIGQTGEVLFHLKSKASTFPRDFTGKLKVNTNADEIVLSHSGQLPTKFSVKTREVLPFDDASGRSRFRVSRQSSPNLRVDLYSSDSVLLNGEPIPWLKDGVRIISADIADHGMRFVLGSHDHIYCANRYGELIWKVPVPSPVLYTNISGNARVMVAMLEDGNIQWFRMSDGKFLLSLAFYDDCKYWALGAPGAYVDYSPGLENNMGVLIADPPSGLAALVPLAGLDSNHYQPALFDQLPLDWDVEKALLRAGLTALDLNDLHDDNSTDPFDDTPFQPSEPRLLPRYHLVVASYADSADAQKRAGELINDGYSNAAVVKGDGRFRVSVAAFHSFSEARNKLREIQHLFKGIWIYDAGSE